MHPNSILSTKCYKNIEARKKSFSGILSKSTTSTLQSSGYRIQPQAVVVDLARPLQWVELLVLEAGLLLQRLPLAALLRWVVPALRLAAVVGLLEVHLPQLQHLEILRPSGEHPQVVVLDPSHSKVAVVALAPQQQQEVVVLEPQQQQEAAVSEQQQQQEAAVSELLRQVAVLELLRQAALAVPRHLVLLLEEVLVVVLHLEGQGVES